MEYASPQNVFLLVSLSGIFLFLAVAPMEHIRVFDWIAMENNSDWALKDYYRHLFYSIHLETCYGSAGDTVFSPLAYILYHLIYSASYDPLLLVESRDQMISMPYQAIVFLMYSLAGVLLLVFDIELLRLSLVKRWLLVVAVLFSVPCFMGGLERGNLTVHCAALLAMAMLLKDRESSSARECALLLIALSASLKIYAAAVGLAYLAERRWGEAKRLVVYGVATFFAPFVFLGGFDGCWRFFHTIGKYAHGTYTDRIEFFQGVLNYFGIVRWPSVVLSGAFLILLITLVCFTRSRFRRYVFLAAMLAFVPAGAYRYALLYFLMPLFFFMKDAAEPTWTNYVSAILFGSVFTIPTALGLLTDFRLAYGSYAMTCVEVFVYLPAWGLLAFHVAAEMAERFKERGKTWKD